MYSGVWEHLWEKVWNNLKSLKRCAEIFNALKVWKWGFAKSKKVWNQIKIWTLTSMCILPVTFNYNHHNNQHYLHHHYHHHYHHHHHNHYHQSLIINTDHNLNNDNHHHHHHHHHNYQSSVGLTVQCSWHLPIMTDVQNTWQAFKNFLKESTILKIFLFFLWCLFINHNLYIYVFIVVN